MNQQKIPVKQADKSNLDNIQKMFESSIIYLNNQEMDIFEKQTYDKYLSLFSQIQMKKFEFSQNNINNQGSQQEYIKHSKNLSYQQNQSQDMIKIFTNYGDRRESRESFEMTHQNSYLLKTEQSDCASTTSLKQQSLNTNPISRNKTQAEIKFICPQNRGSETQNRSYNTIDQLSAFSNLKNQQILQFKRDSTLNLSKTNTSINTSQENIDKYKKPSTNSNKQSYEKCPSSIEKRLVKKNIPQVNIDFRVLGTNLTNSFNNQK